MRQRVLTINMQGLFRGATRRLDYVVLQLPKIQGNIFALPPPMDVGAVEVACCIRARR